MSQNYRRTSFYYRNPDKHYEFNNFNDFLNQNKNAKYNYIYKDPRTGQYRKVRIDISDEDTYEFKRHNPYNEKNYYYEDERKGFSKFTPFFVGFFFTVCFLVVLNTFVLATIYKHMIFEY